MRIVRCCVIGLLLGAAGCGGKPAPVVVAPKQTVPAHEQRYAEGEKAARSGDWRAAAQHFGAAGQLEPTFSKARINHGIALERSGDAKAACAVYRSLLDENADDVVAAGHLGRCLVQMGDFAGALKHAGPWLERRPDDLDLRLTRAAALVGAQKMAQARREVREVLRRDHENAMAFRLLGEIETHAGNLRTAENLLRRALKITPDDADVYVALGLLMHRQGEGRRALLEFEQALVKNPQHPIANTNVGVIALSHRDYTRAAKAFAIAKQQGVGECVVELGRGHALEGQQDGKAAIEALSQAHALCGDDNILLSIGLICLTQTRDNDCALQHFERFRSTAKKLDPKHRVYTLIDSVKQLIAHEEQQRRAVVEEEVQSATDGEQNEGGEGAPEASAPGGSPGAAPSQQGAHDGGRRVWPVGRQ